MPEQIRLSTAAAQVEQSGSTGAASIQISDTAGELPQATDATGNITFDR
ncbi:hypothetical protein [Lentzea guizhouensis]|nr:hypothetical protein [Lentzea guizhouensis]